MSWTLNIRLISGQLDSELLISTLWDLGTSGVAEVGTQIVAGFESESAADRAKLAIEQQFGDVLRVEIEQVVGAAPETSYVVEFAPLPEPIVILLDTGSVFGHGAHPTTQLVLDLLAVELSAPQLTAGEPSARSGKPLSVLDVGTGSGILAIAAAKVGSVCIGIDNSTEAVTTARRNAIANGVNVEVSEQRLDDIDQKFDLVLCNVLLNVHRQLAPSIVSKIAAGGALLISGVLETQKDELVDIYASAGVEIESVITRGEWLGLKLISVDG